MGTPNATGKNSTLKLFRDGEPVGTLVVQSWKCKPNVTAIADGVCGEDRDQLDTEINYYELTLTCFTKDLTVLDNLLAAQAARDGGANPDMSYAIILKPKDGSKGGYVGKEGTFDDWEIGAAGRTDRIMMDVPVRCRYFDKSAL